MAPLRPAGFASARAVVLVPDDLTAEQLVADITPEPGSPWQSEATRTVRRAVRQGRDASRAERRMDRGAARSGCEQCSESWAEVGDDRRSTFAARYARDPDWGQPTRRGSLPPRPRTDEPFVVDQL